MELPGSGFFYAMAGLAMTFSGFTAIVVVLRQGTGGQLSSLHVLFTRFFIECGLMVALFGVVPPLLGLSGIGEASVWRASSLVLLVITIPYCYYYPKRRRRAAPTEKVPPRFYVLLAVGSLDFIALLANVIGWPFAPNSFPIAVLMVFLLCAGAIIFLATYTLFLTPDRDTRAIGDATENLGRPD
jgi:hypothetical protein